MTWNVNHKGEVPVGSPWTAERTKRLELLWLEGLSCSKIAAVMQDGITRNAVIGKVHRIGLPNRQPRLADRPKRTNRVPHNTRKSDVNAGALTHKLRSKSDPKFLPAPLPPAEVWHALPGTAPIGLLDLTEKTCRWPIGDDRPFKFCGCPPAHGSPYCATHQASATRVIPVDNYSTRQTSRFDGAGIALAL